MKILITGGCGFVGLNLVEFLLEKTDWQINILDNLSESKLDALKNIKNYTEERIIFFNGDIRNKEDIEKAILSCDYVVNLAAQVGVMPSVKDPIYDAEINIIGLINVLNACVKNKIKKVVQASSAAPLGDQEQPMREEKVPKPLSPYGASKLAGEAYCRAFNASYGLKTVALRFSNIYGPYSYGKGSVIPLFIQRMIEGKQVIIYGDGEQTRDYIYVKDVCNGIYLALTKELEEFELFHISTGKETSLNELFKIIKEEVKTEIEPKYEPARAGEIIKNYSDISKARKLLGFKPEVDIKEGIKKTVEWFLSSK